MAHVFRLKDSPGGFLTRREGEEIRKLLLDAFERTGMGDTLSIDFSGVHLMTPSFADESLGKFAERLGRESFLTRVELVGANETIRELVNSILAERLAPRDNATR